MIKKNQNVWHGRYSRFVGKNCLLGGIIIYLIDKMKTLCV